MRAVAVLECNQCKTVTVVALTKAFRCPRCGAGAEEHVTVQLKRSLHKSSRQPGSDSKPAHDNGH